MACLSCCSLLFELDVEHLAQLVGGKAAGARVADGAGEGSLHAAQALFAQEIEILLRHEASLAGNGGHVALRLEILVGALGRDRADAQLRGERADGRELLACGELPCGDGVAYLRCDLLVDGLVR